MNLPQAARLLTAHAQRAYTLHREAGAALALGAQSAPLHLAQLAGQAECTAELATLWDAVLLEAHAVRERDLFPLADPARLVAAVRTLRTRTHDAITRAYDLTGEHPCALTRERPAAHWAARMFLLHTEVVDRPGAATASSVLTELRSRLAETSDSAPPSDERKATLELINAILERLSRMPQAARDIPANAGKILSQALAHAGFHEADITRTAVIVPLPDGRTIRIDDGGSADHAPEDHGIE
ncbi:hypothetical protein [Streptomyces sp. cg36]|uniref:hypothetical protein n=1 Tax=Streptomyces sp. cg36 TaxID=3238798 RepID=UPI0034E282F7